MPTPIRATSACSNASPRCSSRRSAQSAPDPLPLPEDVAQDRHRQETPRRAASCGSCIRRSANWATICPRRSSCSPARPGRFSIAGSRPKCCKATLATDAIIGAFASPSLARQRLRAAASRDGRSRRRARRVGLRARRHGRTGRLRSKARATIWASRFAASRPCATSSPNDGRVCGVRLGDGTQLEAPSRRLERRCPSHVREVARRRRSCPRSFATRSHGSTTRRPRRRSISRSPSRRSSPALPSSGIAPHHHGTMHIGPTLDYPRTGLRRRQVRPAQQRADPRNDDAHAASIRTIAPPGKHILSMFVQYAPYKLADGQTGTTIKEEFADRCIEVLAAYAPNVPARIEHRQVLSPLDLERTYRPHRRQHHARGDGAASALLLAARRRLGRSSHADCRACICAAPPPSRRRRDGRLRQERRGGNSSRRVTIVGWAKRHCVSPP